VNGDSLYRFCLATNGFKTRNDDTTYNGYMRPQYAAFKLRHVLALVTVAVVFAFIPSLRAQRASPSIRVTGDVEREMTFTAEDLAKMQRAAVSNRNNSDARAWEGVWLIDILKKAGVPAGPTLRGSALTTYVVVSASDGYRVLFSLAELDPEMTDSQFLVADTAGGRSFISEGESFRLVVPKDKQGARSVRMITKIEVVRLRN
jgi:DMSO/TMAO reductase YedYZ molybdopterin-dependent catalytic subunit